MIVKPSKSFKYYGLCYLIYFAAGLLLSLVVFLKVELEKIESSSLNLTLQKEEYIELILVGVVFAIFLMVYMFIKYLKLKKITYEFTNTKLVINKDKEVRYNEIRKVERFSNTLQKKLGIENITIHTKKYEDYTLKNIAVENNLYYFLNLHI